MQESSCQHRQHKKSLTNRRAAEVNERPGTRRRARRRPARRRLEQCKDRTGEAAPELSGWRGRGFEGPARGGRWGEAADSARTDGHAAPSLRARAVREGEARRGESRGVGAQRSSRGSSEQG
ncbi:hypothetical protein PVAP13_9NG175573 [Panicum virgatum]|uniref:Uncharacterized protein n=1 Tax=Panicum virgatum TaxID=38727 RepID=A0A8T0MJI2_PANVG|nr:hypothetical protein PVAP13_9NG175573 [Panicum virgatum]